MIINRNIRLMNYKPWVKDRTLDLSSQLWHLWNDFQNSFTKRFLRQHATSGLNFDSISTIFTGNHSSRAVCFVICSFCLVFFGLCVVVLFFITLLLSYACMFVRPVWKKTSQSVSQSCKYSYYDTIHDRLLPYSSLWHFITSYVRNKIHLFHFYHFTDRRLENNVNASATTKKKTPFSERLQFRHVMASWLCRNMTDLRSVDLATKVNGEYYQ